ncbi:MAG: nucleoside 2-deoxyribosyltransferase [Nanoarchaeota archaeon]|nr:nucleoside 2-deoxyribosyltransferase [Nanoarchaeota archaeon]
MKEVKGYLANQLGFSKTGEYALENLIKSPIREIGIKIHDPFIECEKEQNISHLNSLKLYDEVFDYWKKFSYKVNPINNALMRDSDCMFAILDGGHQVDEGVASEIGFYAGIERGPIFALRSDFRGGENLAVPINTQVLGYIYLSKGNLFDGKNAIKNWLNAIRNFYDHFQNS